MIQMFAFRKRKKENSPIIYPHTIPDLYDKFIKYIFGRKIQFTGGRKFQKKAHTVLIFLMVIHTTPMDRKEYVCYVLLLQTYCLFRT